MPIKIHIPCEMHWFISYGYRKIKCLQALSWWATDLTLRGKIIDLNHFKTDILADDIDESCINLEDRIYGKG